MKLIMDRMNFQIDIRRTSTVRVIKHWNTHYAVSDLGDFWSWTQQGLKKPYFTLKSLKLVLDWAESKTRCFQIFFPTYSVCVFLQLTDPNWCIFYLAVFGKHHGVWTTNCREDTVTHEMLGITLNTCCLLILYLYWF